jgi:hypothetical protein
METAAPLSVNQIFRALNRMGLGGDYEPAVR